MKNCLEWSSLAGFCVLVAFLNTPSCDIRQKKKKKELLKSYLCLRDEGSLQLEFQAILYLNK